MFCRSTSCSPFFSVGRSDLPGYLSDSEADGVCVINYYHKQFKHAAKKRYFLENSDYLYFHSYMSDYFLGTYGGGIPKPFRYPIEPKAFWRRANISTFISTRPTWVATLRMKGW
jgi:hypothetical protein